MEISKSLLILIIFVIGCQSEEAPAISKIAQRKGAIQRVLNSGTPLLTLPEAGIKLEIQDWLSKDSRMQDFYFSGPERNPILNEVFQIAKARPTDFPNVSPSDLDEAYRIDVYNYGLNLTLVALMHTSNKRILDFNVYQEMQPEIPPHLAELALEIARNDDKVIDGWGCAPGIGDSRMEATKTALNQTKCQRSRHLCVAPTFVKGDKALWAIVDLTEMEVAGIKWTPVGSTGPALSERLVQNEMVMDCYCLESQEADRMGWSFEYGLTRSDGLAISNIRYKDKPLYKSIKLVDWHVSYSETAQFGYSDAIGCPAFSHAAVIAIEAPEFKWMVMDNDTIGFALEQDYFSEGWPTPCSYNYRQRFEFYKDGSLRPAVASLGRGCGEDGIYRPVTRIAIDGKVSKSEIKSSKGWTDVANELWTRESESLSHAEDSLLVKFQLAQHKIGIEANLGQFKDGGRGDLAYLYLTNWKENEGEGDLPTIGPCCNDDYRQGPEKFIEDGKESLGDEVVMWYVPEIHNDGRPGKEYCWAESNIVDGITKTEVYPCYSGPKLKIW